MKPRVSLRDALGDPDLLADAMPGESRMAMRALLLAALGEALSNEERQHFTALTQREREPLQRADELHIIAGRRAGKSSGIAVLAVYLACLCDWRDRLQRGERGVILVLAESVAQAKVLFRYIVGVFEANKLFANLIQSQTATSLSLRHIDVEVQPADFRSNRGRTCCAVIADEIAYWRNDGSANPDMEIIAAVRPSLVTTNGILVTIGSPYSRRGYQYDRYKNHFGADKDPSIIVARGGTRDFNPSIDQAYVDAELARDPAVAASEWLGLFRSDLAAYVERERVEALVMPGVYEIPYIAENSYVAFVDPSGGSSDSFTLAIATSREPDNGSADYVIGQLVCLREFKPPFAPDSVTREIANIVKSYGLNTVTGDRYAGEWVAERFREHGIDYEVSEKNKSEIYRNALPLLNSGRVDLLDDKRLVAQICGLERKVSRGGRDSIDHAPNAHDDLANAALGALDLAANKLPPAVVWKNVGEGFTQLSARLYG